MPFVDAEDDANDGQPPFVELVFEDEDDVEDGIDEDVNLVFEYTGDVVDVNGLYVVDGEEDEEDDAEDVEPALYDLKPLLDLLFKSVLFKITNGD